VANFIPMGVALLGWIALWIYLVSLDSKVKRIKKDA
jgi:hypothetical protein